MSNIKFYLYYLESQFTGYAPVIRITVFAVSILLLIYLASMFRIFIMGYKARKDEIRLRKFQKKYREKVENLVLSETDASEDEITITLNLNDNILTDWEYKQMTELLTTLKEENKEKLNFNNYNNIVTALSLVEFWEKRLRKHSLFKNKTALRKFDTVSQSIPGSLIAHKVNTKNEGLRKHARSQYIKFSTFDGFKFLDDNFDRDFNSLDAIRIHNALKFRSEQKPLPPLIRWVHTATNEKYQAFLIKEIGLFRQTESAEQLLNMFKTTESFTVKAQIAQTLGMLKYENAIPVFETEYDYNPLSVQRNIIEALGEFKSQAALSFLETLYGNTHNHDLLITIVHNICKIDKERKVFEKLKNSASTDFERNIFKHEESLIAGI